MRGMCTEINQLINDLIKSVRIEKFANRAHLLAVNIGNKVVNFYYN